MRSMVEEEASTYSGDESEITKKATGHLTQSVL